MAIKNRRPDFFGLYSGFFATFHATILPQALHHENPNFLSRFPQKMKREKSGFPKKAPFSTSPFFNSVDSE
jgi:hypothetical protein